MCHLSLPPNFAPVELENDSDISDQMYAINTGPFDHTSESLQSAVFWILAEHADGKKPGHLALGV